MALMHVLSAMNSDEKVLALTVCCCLLYHNIGAQFTNMMYPICDFHVFRFDVWDASTNAVVTTGHPQGLG